MEIKGKKTYPQLSRKSAYAIMEMEYHKVVRLLLLTVTFWTVSLNLNGQTKNVKGSISSIPIGFDAFRKWNLLPMQRIGVRAYMRSTYDRGGGSNDASHFLFMNEEDQNVTLDVKGRGELYFFRANHWHGSPWHFWLDGHDHVIKETATDNPVNAVRTLDHSVFIPNISLVEPWAWTWKTTKGADLIWLPIPFQNSLRIAYSRTCYGTGYYIYHLMAEDPKTSSQNSSGDFQMPADRTATDLLKSAGSDIAPKNIPTLKGSIRLNKPQVQFAHIQSKNSSIRALKLTLPLEKAIDLERIKLCVTWDDAKHPSIEAPLCLFFGAGTLYNRDKKAPFVKGLPINITFDYKRKTVQLACYYPMPFFKSARFALKGIKPQNGQIQYEIRYEEWQTDPKLSSYFHATYRDFPKPELGQDMTWLDTKGIEGKQNWSGSFLGTSFIFSHDANLYTLEGDPRFFFDDSQTPQAYGTGTEEWAGGGDYWGGENMSLPLAGHPCGSTEKKTAINEYDLIQSAYRFLWADMMPFGKRAVIRFEHSENVSLEHYESVCYWYGLPSASLVKTDSLDIGQRKDEREHHYNSPLASEVQVVDSRYEWGPDKYPSGAWGYDLSKRPGYNNLKGEKIYPSHQEDGRYTKGTSSFRVKIDKNNVGIMLRRTLDYQFPNQTAEVYIATTKGKQAGRWQKAGVWYVAGANTCVFSRPEGELSKRQYNIQTSNRRFRDDEFLISSKLTKGLGEIMVKIKYVPDPQMLFPGKSFPGMGAYSELKYTVYSYIIPKF